MPVARTHLPVFSGVFPRVHEYTVKFPASRDWSPLRSSEDTDAAIKAEPGGSNVGTGDRGRIRACSFRAWRRKE
jgi:hypothetical protein